MTVNAHLLERREYKYLIDRQTAEEVRRRIRPLCSVDPFAQEHGRYTIDSLYLDTPQFDLYLANEREQVDRVKLRIRGYPHGGHDPVFLEVKRRTNDVVSKTRAKVPKAALKGLLEMGSNEALTTFEGGSRKFFDRFVYYALGHAMVPRVLVRYEREPWMSDLDDYARVTLDFNICSCEAVDWSLSPMGDWRHVDHAVAMKSNESLVVLELKFESERMPYWMTELVRSLNLQRHSFSKYGRSVEAWFVDFTEIRHAANW